MVRSQRDAPPRLRRGPAFGAPPSPLRVPRARNRARLRGIPRPCAFALFSPTSQIRLLSVARKTRARLRCFARQEPRAPRAGPPHRAQAPAYARPRVVSTQLALAFTASLPPSRSAVLVAHPPVARWPAHAHDPERRNGDPSGTPRRRSGRGRVCACSADVPSVPAPESVGTHSSPLWPPSAFRAAPLSRNVRRTRSERSLTPPRPLARARVPGFLPAPAGTALAFPAMCRPTASQGDVPRHKASLVPAPPRHAAPHHPDPTTPRERPCCAAADTPAGTAIAHLGVPRASRPAHTGARP